MLKGKKKDNLLKHIFYMPFCQKVTFYNFLSTLRPKNLLFCETRPYPILYTTYFAHVRQVFPIPVFLFYFLPTKERAYKSNTRVVKVQGGFKSLNFENGCNNRKQGKIVSPNKKSKVLSCQKIYNFFFMKKIVYKRSVMTNIPEKI